MAGFTIIIDNGASHIKFTILTKDNELDKIISVPNCVARSKEHRKLYIGHELTDIRNVATLQYRRAHEKGHLVSWEVEQPIWDGLLEMAASHIDTRQARLILTEPAFHLSTLRNNTDDMVFEYYGFESYVRCSPAAMIPWGLPLALQLSPPPPSSSTITSSREPENGNGSGTSSHPPYVLVVDSGFSFTHITPVINGVPVSANTKRIDVGGKLLTNHLKELISFRYYDMMEETHLINQIKESCCFVSLDFTRDMERARSGALSKRYVLPDFSKDTPGFVVTEETESALDGTEQLLTLRYELFSVPELLFRPSDVGLQQAGVAESVMQSLAGLPDAVQALLLENIVLIGGSVRFPGFQQRFTDELRMLAPDEFEVCVTVPPDPVTFACACGANMARDKQGIEAKVVTRTQYATLGKKATQRFNDGADFAATTATAATTTTTVKTNTEQASKSSLPRRESKYAESERSDTPRSFSPDTESENDAMEL